MYVLIKVFKGEGGTNVLVDIFPRCTVLVAMAFDYWFCRNVISETVLKRMVLPFEFP